MQKNIKFNKKTVKNKLKLQYKMYHFIINRLNIEKLKCSYHALYKRTLRIFNTLNIFVI